MGMGGITSKQRLVVAVSFYLCYPCKKEGVP